MARLRAACIMLYTVSGVAILFGLLYLLAPRILPYHERFLGLPNEQLDPMIQRLMVLLMKDAGAGFLALGLGTAWLVRRYLARGDRGIIRPIAGMALVALVPVLAGTLRLGWYSPWWVVGGLIGLVIASLVAVGAGAPEGRGARGGNR